MPPYPGGGTAIHGGAICAIFNVEECSPMLFGDDLVLGQVEPLADLELPA